MITKITHSEQALRALWQKARPTLSADEVEIFFSEQYVPQTTVTAQAPDGSLLAAGQWVDHKMTFVNEQTIRVGVVSGLVVDPDLKAADRTQKLSQVLAELHRQQYQKGMMLSIIVPADGKQRQWLEKQGYTTASHLLSAETSVPPTYVPDERLEIKEDVEWDRELWIFYVQHGGKHDLELRLNEADFYAMIARNDALGGRLLVARRRGKVVGLALAYKEGKPLKNGRPSIKQFRVNLRYILATDVNVLYGLQAAAMQTAPDCRQLVMTGGCPAKGFQGVRPHAMMRVVDARRFMSYVSERIPGLQLTVSIDGDTDLPVNNASYRMRDGRCYVNPGLSDSIVGPGAIPARLFSGHPVQIPEI